MTLITRSVARAADKRRNASDAEYAQWTQQVIAQLTDSEKAVDALLKSVQQQQAKQQQGAGGGAAGGVARGGPAAGVGAAAAGAGGVDGDPGYLADVMADELRERLRQLARQVADLQVRRADPGIGPYRAGRWWLRCGGITLAARWRWCGRERRAKSSRRRAPSTSS